MKPILFPIRSLADGFLVEQQQWLWWARKQDLLARLLCDRPWANPCENTGSAPYEDLQHVWACDHRAAREPMRGWDHPMHIWATYAPRAYTYAMDMWYAGEFEGTDGGFWAHMTDVAHHTFVSCHDPATGETHCVSVGELADYEDAWSARWFGDYINPWNKTSNRVDLVAYEWRGDFTQRQRYDILQRDNFCCQICGRTAQQGASLHVDHAIPQAHGGKAVPWNLWTLCADCNLGKMTK